MANQTVSNSRDEMTRLMTSPNRALMAPVHQPKLHQSQGKAVVIQNNQLDKKNQLPLIIKDQQLNSSSEHL